jgi:hypothetical protein
MPFLLPTFATMYRHTNPNVAVEVPTSGCVRLCRICRTSTCSIRLVRQRSIHCPPTCRYLTFLCSTGTLTSHAPTLHVSFHSIEKHHGIDANKQIFRSPADFTLLLSGLIKIGQMLVMQRSVVAMDDKEITPLSEILHHMHSRLLTGLSPSPLLYYYSS